MGIIIVDIKNREPIYEQIISSVKASVIGGLLSADEALPSVRALAGELAINPNTIQKAYSELERQGIVYSVPGRGCFISSNTAEIEEQHKKKVMNELENNIKNALQIGITKDDIHTLINKIQEENNI